MTDISLIFMLSGKKPASKCSVACLRVGMCDSAGMMLNKSELRVPHTIVAELWNSTKCVL